jgi:hypothetical protein
MSSELESLAESLGVNLVSSPQMGEEKTTEAPIEPVVGGMEEESNVLLEQENTQEATETEESVVEMAEEQPLETQDNQESEPIEQQTFDSSEESVLKALSEMVGIENLTMDEIKEIFSGEADEKKQQLDPEVEAIANFIASTGKSAKDWFAYQSFNPSEMDDMTVMMADLKMKYPDLSDEDSRLLMDSKYKLNEDEHSENDIRLAKLQLKMDAKSAREGLEKVREAYRAPERPLTDNTANAELSYESPIDDAWVSKMSKTVDSMKTLKFNVGDKEFNFGLDNKYKDNLKKSNSDLENYFVQYVSEDGQWDFNKLSSHRAIVDNIDAIAKAIYGQGLSDGQSSVVKEAVNPSGTSPSSGSVDSSSAEDRVRKQLLDALRGGDNTLSIKF